MVVLYESEEGSKEEELEILGQIPSPRHALVGHAPGNEVIEED